MRKLSPWLPILSPPIWSLSAAPTPVPLPRCNHYGRVWRVSHYSRETVWVAPVRDDALAISGDAERWPIWGQRESKGLASRMVVKLDGSAGSNAPRACVA